MRKIDILKSAVVAIALVAMGMMAAPVMAIDTSKIQEGIDNTKPAGVANESLDSVVKQVINVFLYLIGVIAVAFIIYGGVKYATSAGDTAKVTSAKNTLMYAVIGLIIAILAYSIVNFVITNI